MMSHLPGTTNSTGFHSIDALLGIREATFDGHSFSESCSMMRKFQYGQRPMVLPTKLHKNDDKLAKTPGKIDII